MPDDVTPPATPAVTPTSAPSPTPAPAAAPGPAPAAAPASPAQVHAPTTVAGRPVRTLADIVGEETPDAAKKRLERAGRQALRAFDIDLKKGDDVDKVAAEYKAKRDSENEERKQLKAQAKEAERYRAVVSAHVATELAGLTEEQRNVIKMAAGDDPAAQLGKLAEYRAIGWIKPVASTAAAPAPAPAPAPSAPAPTVPPATPTAAPVASAPPPIPAPASSAPPQPGPAPTSPNPQDLRAQYDQLIKSNKGSDRIMAGVIAMRNPELFLSKYDSQ